MDLERIKQNFRIRSGRAKKGQRTRKPPPPTDSTRKQGTQEQQSQEPSAAHVADDDSQKTQVEEPVDHKQPSEAGEDAEAAVDSQQTAPDNAEESDFDLLEQPAQQMSASEAEDFDLKPPDPRPKPPSLEDLSVLLFSSHHLDFLLHDPAQLAIFSGFLQRYLPDYHPLLSQYIETQKAIRAIEYANAIAEGLQPKETGSDTTTEIQRRCCTLDPQFESISNASFDALVGDAFPKYISYLLVKAGSQCLTDEITGRRHSHDQELVGGLSEVFCLTDPKQQDNPIIFASEEFYRLTRYGPEDTLNSNCRFLQGRKTQQESVQRLRDAIKKGQEISETLLNYRRDGKPFINLLMIAPLHDKNGKLKYFLGAQIDVTGLVQGGKILDGFQRFLLKRITQHRTDNRRSQQQGDPDSQRKGRALEKLRNLSEMFDLEEAAVVANSRANSLTRDEDDNHSVGSVERRTRRVYADDELSDDEQKEDLSDQQKDSLELGAVGDGRLSGKLPGVYDSFLLLRPAPSLRIVFVSPKLQKIGDVLQTPFLSHVAAPQATINGLSKSLRAGIPVSAKIHFMPNRGQDREGTILKNGTKHDDGQHGKAIWVSVTPMMGDDDRVGVWMCVVVEKSKLVPASRSWSVKAAKRTGRTIYPPEDRPIRPIRVNSQTEILRYNSDPEERSRAIRPMESVYFDAEGGHANSNEMKYEADTSQTALQNEALNPKKQTLPQLREAVTSPVEEYQDPYEITTDDIPVLGPRHNQSPEESINTKSPPNLPRTTGERVIIHEDDSILDEPEDEADRGRSRSSRSNSASWSPVNEESTPRGLTRHDGNDDVVDDQVEPEGLQQNSKAIDTDTDESSARPPRCKQPPSSKKDREEDSPDTLRETSRERNARQQADRDSAIGMDSSAQTHEDFPRTRSYQSQSRRSSKSQNPEASTPSINVEEDITHERDVENWITEGRPVLSQQNTGMDYLRAGSIKRSIPPRLTKQAIEGANNAQEKDESSLDPMCAMSPYSVD